jgi:hypothetical protein
MFVYLIIRNIYTSIKYFADMYIKITFVADFERVYCSVY